MEIRTPITLTPSEYIEGVHQGRFTGDELTNNQDALSKSLSDYLESTSMTIPPYITLAYNATSVTIPEQHSAWNELLDICTRQVASGHDVKLVISYLLVNHFERHLQGDEDNLAIAHMFDFFLAYLTHFSNYNQSNPGINAQH